MKILVILATIAMLAAGWGLFLVIDGSRHDEPNADLGKRITINETDKFYCEPGSILIEFHKPSGSFNAICLLYTDAKPQVSP